MQLMFYIGLKYVSFSGDYPTVWHRIYGFDQATYYLQASVMPVGNIAELFPYLQCC